MSKKVKPEILVETGVANGWSTMCTLAALERNDKGSLYSIDYPTFSDKPLRDVKGENFFGQTEIPS